MSSPSDSDVNIFIEWEDQELTFPPHRQHYHPETEPEVEEKIDRRRVVLDALKAAYPGGMTVYDFCGDAGRPSDWSGPLSTLCYKERLIHNPKIARRRNTGANGKRSLQLYFYGDGPRKPRGVEDRWHCWTCGWQYEDPSLWKEHEKVCLEIENAKEVNLDVE
ncbi:MAG: hypothetical protein HKO53_01400 [Gemmatimonadetes bacterium]|nr:hypothetical protein [Gemmatimonadota bacterium]